MKTASVSEIKKELQDLAPAKLAELCLKLIKYKKENKELLTYLLFESHDEQAYTENVQAIISEGFSELPRANLHLTKKSVRKILRITNKYIRYTGSKQVETELLLYFCKRFNETGLASRKSMALHNIFIQQQKKIEASLATLHEDLQYDYRRQLQEIF